MKKAPCCLGSKGLMALSLHAMGHAHVELRLASTCRQGFRYPPLAAGKGFPRFQTAAVPVSSGQCKGNVSGGGCIRQRLRHFSAGRCG